MSMLQVSAIGRLTADVELKSGNNVNFVGFNLAVNTGYGDKAVTEYLQCILFDAAAEKFIKAGAKKGSLIWLTGKLSLRTFKRKSDDTQDKCMNVQVFDWGYVPSGSKEKTDGEKADSEAKPSKPEKEFTHYDETSVGEDEELPF